jgi:hypothetical protein
MCHILQHKQQSTAESSAGLTTCREYGWLKQVRALSMLQQLIQSSAGTALGWVGNTDSNLLAAKQLVQKRLKGAEAARHRKSIHSQQPHRRTL